MIEEFICLTCKGVDVRTLEWLLFQEPDMKSFYVPKSVRFTDGIGIIFTRNSVLFKNHVEYHTDHKWGNYNQILESLRSKDNLI